MWNRAEAGRTALCLPGPVQLSLRTERVTAVTSPKQDVQVARGIRNVDGVRLVTRLHGDWRRLFSNVAPDFGGDEVEERDFSPSLLGRM